MTWNASTVYEQRVRFVLEVQQASFSFKRSCERYGISRTTGYEWWGRFQQGGLEALQDRSHRPHTCPHATPPEVEARILELRHQFGWGPRKLRKLLCTEFGWAPARDTIGRILKRHGLVTPRRRGPSAPLHPGQPDVPMDAPNATWTVDFKGHFRMRNGRYCYPLTVQDAFSRFLLCCTALSATSVNLAKPVFKRLFRTYGLPAYILSDNGSPFASIGLGRLTRLRAWWIRLGIHHLTIAPGHPEQNPRHERMHRTLKREATRPPQSNFTTQQRHFDDFCHTFNHVRPHEALNDDTPANCYAPSSTPYPGRLPRVTYPPHFEVRKVSTNGGVRWNSTWVNLSSAIPGQPVGFEPFAPHAWQVYYAHLTLGWFDEDTGKVTDEELKTGRNPKTYS